MSELLQQLNDLTPAQLEELRKRLRGRPHKMRSTAAGWQRYRGGPISLTPAQQSLWLAQRLDPTGSAFLIVSAIRLDDSLDVALLGRAAVDVVERHEVLRLVIRGDGPSDQLDSGPMMEPVPGAGMSGDWRAQLLEVIEESELESPRGLDAAVQDARQRALGRIDLDRPPLVRWLLYRLPMHGDLLVMTVHHIAADHASVALLWRELAISYRQEEARLPEPSKRLSYLDFAATAQERDEDTASLEYWREHLSGLRPWELREVSASGASESQGERREELRNHSPGYVPVAVDDGVLNAVKRLARERDLPLFSLLALAWAAVLQRVTGSSDIVFGAPMAGRPQRELETVVGLFFNTVVVRLDWSSAQTWEEGLDALRTTLLDAQDRQHVPFQRVVEIMRPERRAGRTPLIDCAINVQEIDVRSLRWAGVSAEPVEIHRGPSNLALYLSVEHVGADLAGVLEFDARRISTESARAIAKEWERALAWIAVADGSPEALRSRIEESPWSSQLIEAAHRVQLHGERSSSRLARPLTLAATFTAEPVEPVLRFWIDWLDFDLEPHFAPYHQVLQQLLDPRSTLRQSQGPRVLMVRWEDWARDAGDLAGGLEAAITIALDEFIPALESAAQQGGSWWVVSCPASSKSVADAAGRRSEARWVAALEAMAQRLPAVELLTSRQIFSLYPVDRVEDSRSGENGHIPYTAEAFIALGSALSRRLNAHLQPRYKVVALDCDNTLWRYACGEVGAQGVGLDSPFDEVQRFFLQQKEEGRLLCLTSKNRERDVWEVFQQRPDMVLGAQDVVASKIRWTAKSRGLRELAAELDLGLDSFVFVDDSPVEHAEVQAKCAQVLSVPMTVKEDERVDYLRHHWAFDAATITAEDAKRTELYRDRTRRREAQRAAPSLEGFIESLELAMEVGQPAADALGRVSQLTQRTNQFNASGLRLTESDVAQRVASDDRFLDGVRVRDRFGDYGLVGVLGGTRDGNQLVVDLFLLSCRVLGRSVEFRLLRRLGQQALEEGLEVLSFHFQSTARNAPVLHFLSSVAAPSGAGEAGATEAEMSRFVISAQRAAELDWRPYLAAQSELEEEDSARAPAAVEPVASAVERSRRLHRIASRWREVSAIRQAVEEFRQANPQEPQKHRAYEAPGGPVEQLLAGLWQEVLGSGRVGRQDHFFDLGGHSLAGTVLLSRVFDELEVELELSDLFEAPTLRELAKLVTDRMLVAIEPDQMLQALGGADSPPEAREPAAGSKPVTAGGETP